VTDECVSELESLRYDLGIVKPPERAAAVTLRTSRSGGSVPDSRARGEMGREYSCSFSSFLVGSRMPFDRTPTTQSGSCGGSACRLLHCLPKWYLCGARQDQLHHGECAGQWDTGQQCDPGCPWLSADRGWPEGAPAQQRCWGDRRPGGESGQFLELVHCPIKCLHIRAPIDLRSPMQRLQCQQSEGIHSLQTVQRSFPVTFVLRA
jgi:hypothetical protein